MMNIEDKIWDYVEGTLDASERSLVEAAIAEDASLQKLHNEYQLILSDMQSQKTEQPSAALNNRFYKFLDEAASEQHEQQAHPRKSASVLSIRSIMKYAAIGIVLFASVLVIRNQWSMRPEQSEMHFAQAADTDRIKAILVSDQKLSSAPSHDQKILTVLIDALRDDPSSHVRLASVETLSEYLDNDLVRSAMIRALGVEKDPQVQISIIIALSSSKDKDALEPLQELTEKENVFDFIKKEAHAGIMRINSI